MKNANTKMINQKKTSVTEYPLRHFALGWKWALGGALIGLLIGWYCVLSTSKVYKGHTTIQLSTYPGTEKDIQDLLIQYSGVANFPPKISKECGIGTLEKPMYSTRIKVTQSPIQKNSVILEALSEDQSNLKNCINNIINEISALEKFRVNSYQTIYVGNIQEKIRNLHEINRTIKENQGNINSNLVAAILLPHIQSIKNQITLNQRALNDIESTHFSATAVEIYQQPYLKKVLALFIAWSFIGLAGGVAARHIFRTVTSKN